VNHKLKQLIHTQNKEIMYEVLEHWKQYKLEKMEKEAKRLQEKIKAKYELDKWITELSKNNGVTLY